MRELNNLAKRLYKAHIKKVEFGIKSNPKSFWAFINSKKKHSGIPCNLFYGNIHSTDSCDAANLFASYFSASFDNTSLDSRQSTFEHITSLINIGLLSINENDVCFEINSLNNSCKQDVNGLCPYFLKKCVGSLCSPLTNIFNLSLRTGTFPNLLKLAIINPLHKKGNKCDIENYRPVSKLSSIAKIFENIIKQKLSFEVKRVISPYQHGFVKGRSCESNLAVFNKFCMFNVASHKQVDTIYTDFSKAFDKISHALLIKKLAALGFHSAMLSWFSTYLLNRESVVVVDDCVSRPFVATSGVPQGSILGPLLFTLFINDIGSSINHSQFLLFADDLKLYRTIECSHDMQLLQSDINSLVNWCKNNNLFLNVQKCYYMNFCKRRSCYESSYYIDGCKLSAVTSMLDLGVVFDPSLTFRNHLDYIIPKAFSSLSFIKRHGRQFRDPTTFKLLYNSFVRSKLEYASFIWNPTAVVHINRLERIQRLVTKIALRPIFKYEQMPSYNSRNLLLGLNSLECRRTVHSMLFIYDIVNGPIDCPCLLETLNFLIPSRSLRHYSTFYIQCYKSNFAFAEPMTRAQIVFNKLCLKKSLDFAMSKNIFKKTLYNNIKLS